MEQLSNYLDGQLAAPRSGRYLDNFEPATGQVYSHVPDSDEDDLAVAVSAAEGAFEGWRATPAEDRARVLHQLADLIDANADALARAESVDSGKPISLARRLDIPRASANLRFFAAAATQFFSEAHPMEGGAINYTLRQPHGVVACISPWNQPLYLFTWKIAPALNQEEIFGPVATLIPFRDRVMSSRRRTTRPNGLAASVWSQDISRCHRLAARLDSGLIWVNTWMLRDLRTPMGGMKHSGVGREGGFETLRFFTEPKNVCIKY